MYVYIYIYIYIYMFYTYGLGRSTSGARELAGGRAPRVDEALEREGEGERGLS